MRRTSVRLLLALLPILAIAGCKSEGVLIGGTDGPRYTSLVSLSPSTTELVGRYGNWRLLKGRTAACDFPTFIEPVPVVAQTKPDFEKIAGIAPDLVLYDESLYNEADVERIKGLGAKEVFVITAQTVNEFIDQLYKFGALVGGETNVSKYADDILAAVENAKADQRPGTPKVAILMGGPGSYYISGKSGFLGDVINLCGGELVGPEGKEFQPANVESLIALNPDLIMVAGGSAYEAMVATPSDQPPPKWDKRTNDGREARAILADPQLQSIKAVKTGAVAAVASDVLLRRGARLHDLIKATAATIVAVER